MFGHTTSMVRGPDGRRCFVSIDQISTTVATVLSEYLKSSERTIFWDDELKMNKDPFENLEGGFFTADWDFKVSASRLFNPLPALMSLFFA
jgi:hypothetical protein